MEQDLELGIFGTTSLGALIAALKKRDQKESVSFDFARLVPDRIDSYRGFYDHLAIGYATLGTVVVSGLLADLQRADGQSYTGYKGGTYRMGLKTPIWVANYGETGSTAIVGIAECSWATIIRTKWVSV